MDVRMFAQLVTQARIAFKTKELIMIQAARLAQADKASFEEIVSNKNLELNALRMGVSEEQLIKDSWDELQSMGGA